MISCLLALSLLTPPIEAPNFDKDSAWKHLLTQCAFGPRVPGTPNHVKCRDYIKESSEKYCDSVQLQPFTHNWTHDGSKRPMWNILASQGWETAKVRVALFAHWDTRPFASQESSPQKQAMPILGANDGASGVAVLLELMKSMKGVRPADLGIMYVFVDGEDLGPELEEMFLGATYFGANLPEQKPNYGILLDMIGDKDLRVPMEPNSFRTARPLLAAFYRHAQSIGMSKTFPADWGPEILDDHLSISKAGVPTIDLIDFDYEPWHTLEDTPKNCSTESLGKVGRMLFSWLRQNPVWQYPRQ